MAGMGPPRSSQRRPERGLGGSANLRLPAAGRQGAPPRWPLSTAPSKSVAEVWVSLWATPQATAWERLGHVRVVARYARCLVDAEKRNAPAALLAEVRQMEDRLGLSPMAMLRLRWEIGEEKIQAEETGELAGVTQIDEYRDLYG